MVNNPSPSLPPSLPPSLQFDLLEQLGFEGYAVMVNTSVLQTHLLATSKVTRGDVPGEGKGKIKGIDRQFSNNYYNL